MHLLLRHPKIGLGSLVYACSFLYSAVSNIYIFKFNATCLIKHKHYICRSSTLKGGLSLKIKIKSCPCGIYIYMCTTKLDPMAEIIYRNRQKIIFNLCLELWAQCKSRKNIVLFFILPN